MEKSVRTKVMATGMTKPLRQNTRGNQVHHHIPSPRCSYRIDQRKWNDIPAVDYVYKRFLSYRLSKTLTRILRHQGSHREDDGALDWEDVVTYVVSRLRIRECLEMDESGMAGPSS